MSISSFIDCIKRKSERKEYSFAIKVFNFIHPDECPIIDRLSATILWMYLSESLHESDLVVWIWLVFGVKAEGLI